MAVTASKAKIGVCILGFVGVALLFIGIVALSIFPSILKAKIEQNLVLAEGKETYEKWRKTPVPVYFSIFIFNVTNPSDIEHRGKKPILQEVGPFVFKQHRSKTILGWDHENLTVTYDDIKSYQFVPSMSQDMEEKVYTLNMPLLGLSKFAGRTSYLLRSFITSTLDNLLETYGETLFVHKPVRELLFEGYKVSILEDLIGLAKPFTTVPNLLPNNTFGFLYGKNNSGDGVFSVYTGEDDIAKYTQIAIWNNMSRMGWWNDDYCDMLNGTDGAQFPPPVTKNDILYVYTAELCRSVFLEYVKDVHVEGIPAYRFVTPARLFASPKDNPDNQCYCTRPELCNISGILDISSCRNGIPLAVTAPHFYQGHEYFTRGVDGLHPSKAEHETYVDIEPATGIVLRASRKLQMNYILEKDTNFRQTSKIPDAVFPLIWIREAAEIDSEIAAMFTSKVRTPITVAKSVLTACIVLGILWIVTAGFVTVYILIKQQKATEKTPTKVQYTPVPLKSEENSQKNEKYHPVST